MTAIGNSGGRAGSGGSRPARPVRPRELQDGLNHYLYHPLAWRLALILARTPLTPNMVSVLGACFVIAAGIAYAQPGWPGPALLGMALHMGWHVVDGADGDLARITGKASPIGEMVDGICDYASHVVLYLILGWLLYHQIGHWSWPLMLAAGLSHIVQANHVEVQKRSYQWWVYGVPWARLTHGKAGSATSEHRLGSLVSLYLAVASGTSSAAIRIDEAVDAAANDPDRREAIRAAARTEMPRLMPILKVLGPNPRAIVLGLSMLAGSPAWYFLWLVVGLNLLLVVSVKLHARAAERMVARIDG